MNKMYLFGTIGVGQIHSVAREIGCNESDIILVENAKDIPVLEQGKQNEESFKITDVPIIEMSKLYDFEFGRKRKKPKNKDWQKRIKDLQRRNFSNTE